MNGAYLGILRWSIAHQDGTHESPSGPMAEADRKWLMEAIDTLVVDDVESMKVLVKVLQLSEEGKDTWGEEPVCACSVARVHQTAAAAAAAASEGGELFGCRRTRSVFPLFANLALI